ncbi:hypothetical protein ABZX92_02275 [Lentzea sp. NPDC006480]|uniref:hypothetical protein n=1 Tax=Lentzea sp. NPDC006480 TaxID=3157176 RepID=UPI0033BC4F55
MTRVRALVAAALLVLLVSATPLAPAQAQSAKRCADMFNITKPVPARNQLPGFGNGVPPPGKGGRYNYENPGENARGLKLPDDPDELPGYGVDTTGKTPGTKEHAYAAWNRYVARKQKELDDWNANPVGKKPSAQLAYGRWLNSYIPNMGNDFKGTSFEKFITEEIGLGGNDWICQDQLRDAQGKPVAGRFYDAINHKEKIIYEFKAGKTIDPVQLAKDAQFAKQHGYRIQYLFGQQPSKKTIEAIKAAGLEEPQVRKAKGVGTIPVKPTPGPSTKLLNPNPNVPAKGAANDMFDRAGRNPAEARSVQDADDDFQRRSARPDGKVDGAPRRPGGIDFSTMELRYLSDSPDGVQYAFEADDNLDEEENPSSGGLETAELTSDALFTWLALPVQSFWVNLNPDQPDKIVDPQLAKTDAGRVLLQADLRMKRTMSKIMVPDNPVGKRFWDSLQHVNGAPCWVSHRVWAEAAPASVRESGGELYILDAPLKIQAEPLVITTPSGPPCTQPKAVQEHNFDLIKTIIIPEVEKAVNTAPEYQDLRSVYHSRVAAEWIRQRNELRPGAYAKIIGSGNADQWPARTPWKPEDVFTEYLKSYKEGDFKFERKYEQDGEELIFTFHLGGVILDKAPKTPMPEAQFTQQYPTLPDTVADSRDEAITYEDTDVSWLGGDNNELKQQPNPPQAPQAPKPPLAVTGATPLGLLALGVLLVLSGTTLVAWKRRRA